MNNNKYTNNYSNNNRIYFIVMTLLHETEKNINVREF